MTDEQRQRINEGLAGAMGATNFREITLYSLAGPVQKTICDPPPGHEPNLRIFDCAVTGRKAFSAYQPPDFTGDARASRELVVWLIHSPHFRQFLDRLFLYQSIVLTDAADHQDVLIVTVDEMKRLMVAPLENIALAAFRAIGGKDE